MKHKIIVFCLGVTLAFGLTACGNNEERRTGVQEQERVSQDEQTAMHRRNQTATVRKSRISHPQNRRRIKQTMKKTSMF